MRTDATSRRARRPPLPAHDLDLLLEAQIAIAWAGEAGNDEKRLGWWKTDLMSEYGGGDLFARLLPHSAAWAQVQAVREAARRNDAQLRSKVHDPDTVFSLYRLGFEIDEAADERLLELKRDRPGPDLAFPRFAELMGTSWDRGAFERWLASHEGAGFTTAPAGRQIKGAAPETLGGSVHHLVAAFMPLSERYPMPHFRRAR